MERLSIQWSGSTKPSAWALLNELSAAGFTVSVYFHVDDETAALRYVEMKAWCGVELATVRIEIDRPWCIDTLSTSETAAYCCALTLLESIAPDRRAAA